MAEFSIADAITRKNEGGWQNDPDDTGNNTLGWGTYKGLASAKQPRWKGWPIVAAEIAKKPPQPRYGSKAYEAWVDGLDAVLGANEELQRLVKTYYKRNFWDVNSLDDIRCQGLANHVYDHGVSRGTATAALLLQKLLDCKLDGTIGPVTAKAANKARDNELEALYRAARKADYKRIIGINPKLAKYQHTWISRC